MTNFGRALLAGCPGGDTVGALVAGALSDAERAAIANHAASCDGCHALIEGLVEAPASSETAPLSNDALAGGDGQATGIPEIGRGTRVGRYVICGRLGAGGMGIVHAAVDSELYRRVAVKLLRSDHQGPVGSEGHELLLREGRCARTRGPVRAHGSAGRERLLREARSLARLSHPNVVTVFDVGEHRGQPFIAMELVDGGSLSAWLRGAPRSADEIIERMIQAGRGVAAAHAAGIVHRDIKPDNILVGLDGRVRVTDFGLAQFRETPPVPYEAASAALHGSSLTLTRTGACVGTPAYMAPEQRTEGASDARTDQWSFCATLYEALAGVRPPVAHSSSERCIPRWVRKIVMRGLRDDPAARWPSMDALVTALVRGRRRQRRRTRAGASAIAIAGFAIGIALFGCVAGCGAMTRPAPALSAR